ncbi:hypothetical protein LWI29_024884 [Acer saccharum]|uniref:Uncharacterized protein n=1 Tax=Acer saccharum TaxID=4024 RepID=A0AA39RGF0_ACESA|nr:hypothetical protein LWI29_024884 [Acer saccharum]
MLPLLLAGGSCIGVGAVVRDHPVRFWLLSLSLVLVLVLFGLMLVSGSRPEKALSRESGTCSSPNSIQIVFLCGSELYINGGHLKLQAKLFFSTKDASVLVVDLVRSTGVIISELGLIVSHISDFSKLILFHC